MCGVFGFVSHNHAAPNLDTLKAIANVTEERGPHAFGFAWVDSKGRMHSYKSGGSISNHLGLLAMARDARLLIGHCRWATHGSPAENINNHPHPCDGGWIVHNGVIHNYRSLVNRFRLNPTSECDSEVLGLLIEQGDGASYLKRTVEAVQSVNSQPLVMLGLWARPERLIVVRDGNPLCMGQTKEATYLGSYPCKLPGKVSEVKNGSAFEFGNDKVLSARC